MLRHLFLLLILWSPSAFAQAIVVQPYLQSPTPTSIWICWETVSGEDSSVEWGEGDTLDQRTEGGLHDGPGLSRHHEVHLQGLRPSTKYSYRVHTGDLRGEIYHFVTPPTVDSEASFRLVAVSDMQRDIRNPNRYREIVEDGVINFVRANFGDDLARELGLVLVPGDLVHDGRVYWEWSETFFAPGEALMPFVPFMPVPGNHENDTPHFFDYFHLPDNGTPGFEEHWWYTDYSNVRIIGLDSNGGYRIPAQLDWLDQVLAEACASDHVDFVFAQLHHPFESELWPAGNTNYTGDVIERLEIFSTGCSKPSVHFFGHTHGYSRGQSRDHTHLMVNVATAGGNIDYWGEYRQTDYENYTVSQDEYGFVLVEVEAGEAPRFTLRRVSRGDENERLDNVVRDTVEIRLHNQPPERPTARGALPDAANPDCFGLAVRGFSDPDGDEHQATQWQISARCDDFSEPVVDSWFQRQNWYDQVDRQADDDLHDATVAGLEPMRAYCWRARVRDSGLTWSEWSIPEAFNTGRSSRVRMQVTNPGAEDGVVGWRVEEGIFESLEDGQCNGTSPRRGDKYFAVGGICESGDLGRVSQRIDLSEYADRFVGEEAAVEFGGHVRNYNGQDHPEIFLRFIDGGGEIIEETDRVGSLESMWTQVQHRVFVPAETRAVELVLRGRRNSGTDNDSYFDDVFLNIVIMGEQACDEPPVGEALPDGGLIDAGVLTDATLASDVGQVLDAELTNDVGASRDSQAPERDGSSVQDDSDTQRSPDVGAASSSNGPESDATGCDCRSADGGPGAVSWLLFVLFGALGRRRFHRGD